MVWPIMAAMLYVGTLRPVCNDRGTIGCAKPTLQVRDVTSR
jgi:hypothetical protein